jgi:putative inorganic carbon (HCO3(-)) transporter
MISTTRHGSAQALGAAAGALLALGLALLVGVDPLMTTDGSSGYAQELGLLLLALGGIGLVVLLIQVEPAWPLSLGIAATIFGGYWSQVGSPLPLDRVLFGIGLFSLILRARSPADVLGRKPSGIHLLLVCAALYAISSAIFAGTIGNRTATFTLLDRFGIVPFILFAVAPAAFPDQRRRRILLGMLTVVGAYLAYTSIFGWLGPRSLVIPNYIVDPSIGIHADRARGPFAEAGADGLALFECGVAAIMLRAMKIDRRISLAATAVIAACALSIVLTLTRAIWVGSSVALVVTLLATRETRRYFVPATVAGLAMVIAALAVVPGFSSEASSRTNDQRPIWDRNNINNAALRMVEERPLLGFGWFTFQTRSIDYIRLGPDYPITGANVQEHNVFLSNAAELGLIGTLLWGTALAIAVGGAILRRGPPELVWWRIGLVAIATQWFVVANFVPLYFAFSNALLWLWAGVTSARHSDVTDSSPVERGPRREPAEYAPAG